jgi:hypothetical protein
MEGSGGKKLFEIRIKNEVQSSSSETMSTSKLKRHVFIRTDIPTGGNLTYLWLKKLGHKEELEMLFAITGL